MSLSRFCIGFKLSELWTCKFTVYQCTAAWFGSDIWVFDASLRYWQWTYFVHKSFIKVPAALETCLESTWNSQDVYSTFVGKHEHHDFQMMHSFSQTLATSVYLLCHIIFTLITFGLGYALISFHAFDIIDEAFLLCTWEKFCSLKAFKLYSFGRETACEICWYSSSIWFHT